MAYEDIAADVTIDNSTKVIAYVGAARLKKNIKDILIKTELIH